MSERNITCTIMYENGEDSGFDITVDTAVEVEYETSDYGVEDSINGERIDEKSRQLSDEVEIDILSEDRETIYEDIYREYIFQDQGRTNMDKETDIRFLDRDGFKMAELSDIESNQVKRIFDNFIVEALSDIELEDIEMDTGLTYETMVEAFKSEIKGTILRLDKSDANVEINKLKQAFLKNVGISYSPNRYPRHRYVLNFTDISSFADILKDQYPSNYKEMVEKLNENGGVQIVNDYLEDLEVAEMELNKTQTILTKYMNDLKEKRKSANAPK